MKYIAMILDSFSSRAAAQTALEDACVARWGFCCKQAHPHTRTERKVPL